ncbi:hypothetical protein BVX97_03570 [bacterium E08(2017)]|nr:hypothetical protein BVX97_03570 [bacterium E08(2017)]
MSIRVKIPSALRDATKGEAEVYGEGHNLKILIDGLESKYPGLRDGIYDDGGRLQRFVNIFVNDTNIQSLSNELTSLEDGDEVVIVSAVSTE